MAGDEPEVRRKHNRSPDDGAEEGSKRRKHSHHRSSHRHHRHHRHRSSKHHESKHEEEDLAPDIVVLSPNSRFNYDKEEGEILEEEDCIISNKDLLKKRVDSDVESGEIKPDEVAEKLDNQNPVVHDNGYTFSGKAAEEIELNLSLVPKDDDGIVENSVLDSRDKTDDRLHENSDGKDVKKMYDEAEAKANVARNSTGTLFSGDKEDGLGEFDVFSAESESVKYREKERRHGDSSDRDRTPSHANGDVGHKSRELGMRTQRYESPQKETETEKREVGILRRHDRSRSPSTKEDLDPRKQRKLDRHGVKTDRSRDVEEGNSVRHESRRALESLDTEKSSLKNWNKSVSPESTEAHIRNRSRSRDHARERRSRSRSDYQDGKVHYHEWDVKSDSREKARNESDRQRVVRQSREGRHGSRDSVRDRDRERERERSSSYSRHNPREERHGSRDIRERERDRERERNRDRDRDRDRDRERGDRNRDSYRDYGRAKHEAEHHRDRRSKDPAKEHSFANDNLEMGREKLKRDEDEQEDYEERVALKLAEQEEEDIDRIKEESRKRREAILAKYKQQQLQKHDEPRSEDLGKEEKGSVTVDKPIEQSSTKDDSNTIPDGLESRNDGSDVDVADPLFSVRKSPTQNGSPVFERTSGVGGLGDGSPKSERSTDMFCDDIFGESPAGVRKMGKGDDGLQVERSGLNDNWDDAEGYYSYRFGEVLDGRYEVIAAHGKGVFSTVVRARDLKPGKGDPEEVAIKIIRNNDTMYKAGLEELVILKKLVGADPEDRRHCVRFLSTFKYRNHLCLVFESLHMNLREVLKKFGRNIGLKLTAVRAYAKQLFIALKHLRNCGVLHCDIKPDNMLVNEAKNVLKLCDFGNAMFAGKNEVTPYLVSRFYRAPEIILGLTYDHPLDIWSVGCCLYELYSGKVLFPGPSNNDMLRLHMELKGPFPKKMLRKGAFTEQHFDQDLNFHATEEDPVTKKAIKRLLLNIKPKDIGTIVSSSPGEDPKMLANFKDLLEKIFVLDPEKRMTVSQALNHPFITGK